MLSKNYLRKSILVLMLVVSLILMFGCGGTSSNSEVNKETNRLEAIRERGYIEVVTEPYFAPYEFIDPSKKGEDQYVGSDILLAKYIGEKIGVDVKIIPLEFSAVLSSVTEGKYDLAISALAYTPERSEAMNLSDGYYFSENSPGYGLLIRQEDAENIKGPNDIGDKIVVAQSGSLQELFVNEQIPNYKEFKRVSATTDGFLMVQENKADVCAVSIPMGQLYIEANPDAKLMIVEDFEFEVDPETQGTRIGIPKGETELTEIVNEAIKEVLESGEFEKWHEEYTEYAKSLGL